MKDKKLLDKRAPFVRAGCICSWIWGIALQASSRAWLPVNDWDLGATKFGERRSARSGSIRLYRILIICILQFRIFNILRNMYVNEVYKDAKNAKSKAAVVAAVHK